MSDLPKGKDYVDVDMGHDFDGIREFDNRLPNWWLATLWGAILFAFGYWAYYHTVQIGPSIRDAYAAEWSEHQKIEAERAKNTKVTDVSLGSMAKDTAIIADGKGIFTANCVACHRADGGGGVGPNLTDSAWIHGGNAMDIYKVVSEGVLAKGMPAWKSTIGMQKVGKVVAYILTLKDTNVKDGKAAQGPAGTAEKPSNAAAPEVAAPKVAGHITEEMLVDLSKDAAKVAEGKVLFVTNCAACHKADGGGVIGPNLTDNAWLVGPSGIEIYTSISNGFNEKGMPGWLAILGDESVQKLTAFVLSLQNTNVAGGKAPQGKVH